MTTPAGWYPANDQPGTERYWDGTQWTEQTRPAGMAPPPPPPPVVPVVTPQKGWVARHKAVTSVSVLILIIIIAAIAGGSGGSSTNTNVQDPLTANSAPPVTATSAAPAAAPPTPSKPNDKGWVVQSLLTKDDGLGDWGGTARITNTNDTSLTGTFTFTLERGGQQIGTLQGSADSVASGQTVTVDLVSQDKISAGAFTYAFQTDASF